MSRTAARAFAAFASVFLLSGCYTLRFHHGKQKPEDAPPHEHWHHALFDGLLEVGGPVKVDDFCPNGVYSVENELTFINGAVQEVTAAAAVPVIDAGIRAALKNSSVLEVAAAQYILGRRFNVWTPTTVRIRCAKGPERMLKFAVVRLIPRSGVESGLVDVYTDALVAELRRRPGITVLGDADMSALLGFERKKQLLGCTDESCLTEIAGALGVDRLVSGSVGRVGNSLVVYLALLDPATTRPVASVQQRLTRGDESFLDAVPGLIMQLLTARALELTPPSSGKSAPPAEAKPEVNPPVPAPHPETKPSP